MATIAWNESVPSNTSYVRDAPAWIHSIATGMATALGTKLLYWTPTSGSEASLGEMQLGGPRTFYDAGSASSNSNNATLGQRLFATSDTTELLCYDSQGTYRIGSPYFMESRVKLVSSVSATWLEQSGSSDYAIGAGTRVVNVQFPVIYSSIPFVQASLGGSSIGVEWNASVSSVTQGGFRVALLEITGYSPGVGPTVYWSSLATTQALV